MAELSKSEKKKIVRQIKKFSPLSLILAVVFLAVGFGAGWLVVSQVCKNDCVELLGTQAIVYEIGSGQKEYEDEGIKAIVFGSDISASVEIESNLTPVAGKYVVDTSEAGEYYIKYTINHFKFGSVVKYRTITVGEVA